LGYPHRRPHYGRRTVPIPLSGFGSLSEFHPYITTPQSVINEDRAGGSLPRFVPLQRVSVTGSHIPPPIPNPAVTLRPQGFSPSRRVAPPVASRACFIPVPLMGFGPSRLLSPDDAVRPLERRAPRGFFSALRPKPPLQGPTHRPEPDVGSGVWPGSRVNCPLGLSRFEVSCPWQPRTLSRPTIPSRALPIWSQAGQITGTSGFFCQERSRSLSRSTYPLAVLHLATSQLFGGSAGLGYGFPS
jgi:hypothetical protein